MNFVGIEKTSLVDFDGYISVVLFTYGCNFRCPFCQNSNLVIKKKNKLKSIIWTEIIKILKEKKNKIDAVVITGGEPLIHPDIINKIKEIKKLGFLIKIDTNGTNPKLLKKLIKEKLIDYVAMDIKNSFQKYNLTSGNTNCILKNIKDSIDFIIKSKIKHEFRTTIIKEFHNIKDLISIVKKIKNGNKFVLQRYEDKKECISHGFHPISKTEINKYLNILKKIMPNIITRGY